MDYWKLKLKDILKKMFMQGEISADITNYVKWNGERENPVFNSLVFRRKGDYSYHDCLVGCVADIIYTAGFSPQIQPHGLALAGHFSSEA